MCLTGMQNRIIFAFFGMFLYIVFVHCKCAKTPESSNRKGEVAKCELMMAKTAFRVPPDSEGFVGLTWAGSTLVSRTKPALLFAYTFKLIR